MEDHYLRKTAAQVDDLLDKIDGVEAHAEVNQNAYSKVKVGNVDVEAGSKTATIEFAEGSNVTITPNALTGVVTFSATDTTYSVATDSADGLMSSTDKAKLDNLATVATSGSYTDLTDKPTIPTVNDNTITIQKNGVAVESFTLNQSSNETINITVPVTASDVSALPSSTKYGATFVLSIDSSTYVVTATLKDQDGNTLGSAQTIDLPLETMVVSGSYDSQTKKIVLTLKNGQTVEFSVADLVSGLQTEITSNNKLSADLVDDTSTTNKFTTASDKTKLTNCKTVLECSRAQYEALTTDDYDWYAVIEVVT